MNSNIEEFNYELANGTLLRRSDVIEKITEILSDLDDITCPDLSKILTLNDKSTHYILRYMVANGQLQTKKKQRWTHYSLPNKCLLTDILHPEYKEILHHARHTQGIAHKVDESKIVSYPSTMLGHGARGYYEIYQAIE